MTREKEPINLVVVTLGIDEHGRRVEIPLGIEVIMTGCAGDIRSILEEQSDEPTYEGIERQGNSAWTVSKIFWGPWSRNFLHSSDVMLEAGQVIEALLEKDEVVNHITDLRFLAPMRNALFLFASSDDGITEIEAGHADSKPALRGTFKTNKGKIIQLVGYSTTGETSRDSWQNRLARIAGERFSEKKTRYSHGGATYEFPLSSFPFPDDEKPNTGHTLSTFMEICMLSTSALKKRGILPYVNSLAAGFANCDLPDLRKLKDGGNLGVSIDWGRKKTGKEYTIVPIKIDFYSPSGERLGGGTYNRAHENQSWMSTIKKWAE